MGNFSEYEKSLKEIVKNYPYFEVCYRKLSELYSDKTKELYDIEKAISYARKCAEIRDIEPEYYTGLCYLNSEQYPKAIEDFEKFVTGGDIPPAYSRAYLHLFKAYNEIGDDNSACKWAEKYMDLYDPAIRLQMYRDPTMDTQSLLQNDLNFFSIVSKKCLKLRKKAERYLREYNTWTKSLDKSLELEKASIENEALKQKISDMEKELSSIKEKYRALDLDDEEKLNSFFNEIERNEDARLQILKKIHNKTWIESEIFLKGLLPKFDKLSNKLKKIIQSAEFMFKVNHAEADFSGIILNYAKAVEIILDDKICRPFWEGYSSKEIQHTEIKDHIIFANSPKYLPESRFITLGQWSKLIKDSQSSQRSDLDKISQGFLENLRSLHPQILESESIRLHFVKLRDSRNGSAHTKTITKEGASKTVQDFRIFINDLTDLFY